ncbi:MAG: lipid A biosynthesis acyltransferase [Bacteroidota bacterium]|nr:lipid A biosynthesis acyltransferase [Bacteroidota bacterium]MDP4213377.1 lipid A biosynthesis acyltransferase [Bacteroidota bacterium]MDP4251422.1 lipid A biosynthesis acyltransferase [Bacteroidota bacterium]
MPSWQGRSRGNKTGFRIFVWVLRTGGVRPAYFLLSIVSIYYFFFSGKSSRFLYVYFRQRLGYSAVRSILSIYKNYYRFGQTIIDRVVFMSGIPHRFSFDFEGEDHLRKMVEENQGGLLLSAHVGNWEIAGHLLQRLNTKMNIVMFDGEQRQIKEYMESVTGSRSARIILIRDDLSHIYAIQEALKNNEFVCMHADRYLEGNKTLTGRLLGKTARFPAGPFMLANVFRMPVSFVFAMKESALRYHFYASAPKIYSQAKTGGSEEMLNDFCKQMESCIRRYPVQWYNYYDFWEDASNVDGI